MPQPVITVPHIYLCRYSELDGREGHIEEHEAGLSLLLTGLRELASLKITPKQLNEKIILSEHKKPVLSAPDLSFNISHSHGLAVCAFASESVGIDVERIRPVRENLAGRVLSSAEHECFAVAGAFSDEVFMRFWTLKEAYGKQSGIGISYPVNETCFVLPESFPPEGRCTKLSSPVPGFSFFQWKLPGDYILSLCCGKEYVSEQIMLHFL